MAQVMNPSYYGLAETSAGAINAFLSGLVGTTLAALADAGCVRVEADGAVEPLMAGRIASFYYLHYATMTLFSAAIRADTSHQVSAPRGQQPALSVRTPKPSLALSPKYVKRFAVLDRLEGGLMIVISRLELG